MAENNKQEVETLNNPAMSGDVVAASTQHFLDFAEIKDGVIVMNDGSLRAMLMVSSINFSLKSQEEQDAIIYTYQEFLNSIDFPLQILIQSRKLDIDNYIEKLRDREMKQENELLRIQTAEYIEYVHGLVDMAQIMSKNFYIVVPYTSGGDKKTKKGFKELLNPAVVVMQSDKAFQKARTRLLQRLNHVESGLQSLGLRIMPLETQELIEALYNAYNPATFEQEKLTNLDKLEVHQ